MINLLILNLCLIYIFNFSNVINSISKLLYKLINGVKRTNKVVKLDVSIVIFWVSLIYSLNIYGFIISLGIAVGSVFCIEVVNIVIRFVIKLIELIKNKLDG